MGGCSSAPQIWGCLVPEVPIGDPTSAGQPRQVSVPRMAIIPGIPGISQSLWQLSWAESPHNQAARSTKPTFKGAAGDSSWDRAGISSTSILA